MAWDKNEKTIGFIFIAIVAVALIVNYSADTSFLGSFGRLVTVCDNTEPSTLQEFVDAIDELNGEVNREGSFNIEEVATLRSYDYYRSSSQLGEINLILVDDMTCSEFLKKISTTPFSRSDIPVCSADCIAGWTVIDNHCTYNECYSSCGDYNIYQTEAACLSDNIVVIGEYQLINNKQVLSTSEGFFWCNKDNNLAFLAPTLNAFSNYYNEFEVCEEKDPISTQTDCEIAGGDLVGSQCYCGDEVLLNGDVCSSAYDYYDTDPVSDVTYTITDNNETVVIADGTITTITDGTKNAPANPTNNVMWIIVASFVGVFALWWFFERGPDKGFFQDKKKRRGKRK